MSAYGVENGKERELMLTPEEREAQLEIIEKRKKARQVNVSTDDREVQIHLRELDQPICLFGEGPAERRIRLKETIVKIGEDAINLQAKQAKAQDRDNFDQGTETTWYHEGTSDLKQSRFDIACYSLIKSKERLQRAKDEFQIPESTKTARKRETQQYISSLTIQCSQIGDVRPVSFATFSPDSSMIATASWSGHCKLWSSPDCELRRTYSGHAGVQADCIIFHPHANPNTSDRVCDLATSAHDGSILLWSLHSDVQLCKIDGHQSRVSRLMFHPSGRYLATCCYDNSWRLWDMTKRVEVLHQEGHCKPVHCISFQCDGSVAATGGLDAFGRVWDLRTGRCVMFMEGHLKSIFGIDFSPNGYQIVTGSDDNTAKIWDLRKSSCIYTIPAHKNLVSCVKYQPNNGNYLVTSSYDNTVKIWSDKTWQPLKTLTSDSKIMSFDISPDCKYFVTSSYDRTFKLWGPE